MSNETKVVPVEPTEEMWKAAVDFDHNKFLSHGNRATFDETYKAMIAAAPPSEPATDNGELVRLVRPIADRLGSLSDNGRDIDVPVNGRTVWQCVCLLRGLLERHPENVNLVRVKAQQENGE